MTESLFTLLRAVAWKVADLALVLVDWDGFCEACLPGDRPAGLLRWCARAFASLGLCDAVWWLPYLLTGLVLGGVLFALLPCRRRRWLPVCLLGGTLVSIYPLWTDGLRSCARRNQLPGGGELPFVFARRPLAGVQFSP